MRVQRVIIYTFLAAIMVGCKGKQTTKQPPILHVEVVQASIDSLRGTLNFTSQVQGLYNATIQPRVAGFLHSINYSGGGWVRRGDLLFEIDPASYSTSLYAARAAVESAKADEVLAWRNYNRAIPLVEIDAISQSDFDQYEANYKAAKASSKSAEESLKSAELNMGYTKIYAPIDGLAAKTSATQGDYVGPGTLIEKLTTITFIDSVSIELAIPSAQYMRYSTLGQNGQFDDSRLLSNIELILPDSSIYEHHGQYYYTLKDTPSASSTVVIVAKFANPGQILRAGMFARLRANIGENTVCVLLPEQAVSQMQGINSVWVMRPDSTVEYRRVELGDRYGNRWDVLSGVSAGEVVLLNSQSKMHNGAKVVPVSKIQK